MSDKIKTAWEKVLEKMQQMPPVAPGELARMEYMPQGHRLGAKFMQDKQLNLKQALAEVSPEQRPYVAEGVQEALLLQLALPEREEQMEVNRRAMEGLLILKQGSPEMVTLLNELEYLFNYYQQALQQTRAGFEREFAARSRTMRRSVPGRQAGGGAENKLEQIPGYFEEWSRVLGDLNSRFAGALVELKEKIKSINVPD
ncbi:hypothetical protein [Desulfurispora thermophila]|uniref:hypothetical protein n=1 Tax=Desulfurispora thermophila TaxID=265470 RepID=UPI0012EACB1F|nr:hypothetical protein [Desulfurispora thermophila]